MFYRSKVLHYSYSFKAILFHSTFFEVLSQGIDVTHTKLRQRRQLTARRFVDLVLLLKNKILHILKQV